MERITRVDNLKIAYIGGGSRGWARGFMSDLAISDDISGEVYLYDIDYEAAKCNEYIGNKVQTLEGVKSEWKWKAVETMGEALAGADFVIISILPGTLDEMESDVHTPEKYGIYQSVGDTTGPGGIMRALRTLPMMEKIALAVKEYCPNAWVINYTNPMTLSVSQLYRTFPEIKAFGCCHEVFGTQWHIALAMKSILGLDVDPTFKRQDININVAGVNHFTWVTEAYYKNMDCYPTYRQFAEKYAAFGTEDKVNDNVKFCSKEKVKLNLFLRTGVIAAAGDRHLAEFCPGQWYLGYKESADEWGFGLTTVAERKQEQKELIEKTARLMSGEEEVELKPTNEEGVKQIRALLGLENFVTNVNVPNRGQIADLPLGAVVETNAHFSSDRVRPVVCGPLPAQVKQLVLRIVQEQQTILDAYEKRDLDLAFAAFCADPLVTIPLDQARKLFDEMVENTKEYLTMYF